MRNGALLMMDAMGFKGIWQRVDPALVVQKQRRRWRTLALGIAGRELVERVVEHGSVRKIATSRARPSL
ncbi:MAG: hypothetical protein ACM3NZ_13960 [Betaproteobacteria bacterium]|jgi:hypothetical protein